MTTGGSIHFLLGIASMTSRILYKIRGEWWDERFCLRSLVSQSYEPSTPAYLYPGKLTF